VKLIHLLVEAIILRKWPRKIKKIPTQARAINRVQKILSISLKIVETEGVDALTTTSLSKAADIPVGSIYQYFDTKDDILGYLHSRAYEEVFEKAEKTLNAITGHIAFKDLNERIITAFWQSAKTHKSFNKLTRWANSNNTLWESTAQTDDQIPRLVREVLALSKISIEKNRETVFIKTISTVLSILIDQAIEQEDIAEGLISELKILSTAYVNTLK
jgi:AcrR family transcriptional regulator